MSILSNNRLKSTTVYGTLNNKDNPGILGIGAVSANATFDGTLGVSGNAQFLSAVSFTNLPTCGQTAINANQLITKGFADATYIGSDVKITDNIWTGHNGFNTYLPTSTVTPVNANDLITKSFADSTYTGSGILANANAWTNTNTFNTYLPTSTLTPSTSTQLTPKNYCDLKAPINNPSFTGTVGGIDKTMVGLSNVDNTSDANKPVSTATNTALDLKANLASPALTGTPTAPTASVGTNTTQIATTAFVLANGGTSISTIQTNTSTATGTFYPT